MTVVVSCVALADNKLDAVAMAAILEIDPEVVSGVMETAREMGLIAAVKKDAAKKDAEAKAARLPEDWRLMSKDGEYAKQFGFSYDEILSMAQKFKNYFLSSGAKKVSWSRTWMNWVQTEAERKGKKVHHDQTLFAAPPPPTDSRAGTYRIAVDAWRKSRTWNHALGPEPGEPNCRVPPEILREFGVA
ncbi:hypothetical protein [uncultured Alsobacter sp.]|uniref:hypothetical protein n=1 Tax=uncultured Alsobacter sp. TaxID=1748258 RepID=UPI0025FB9A02|nr:hypothetical protein [uncultured Alsobacter sp.]